MQHDDALEAGLRRALAAFASGRPPSRLTAAMAYALFPGGARLRPQLALVVANQHPDGVARALPLGCALELLHAASLVHDDLPCFDDAAIRRHRPSVHRQFGEATAVLAGDALLTLAFRVVGDLAPRPCGEDLRRVAECATALMHGQGREQERLGGPGPDADAPGPAPAGWLLQYHHDKTGCLFEAAAAGGAVAAALPPGEWAAFGRAVGATYQLADDLSDVVQGAAVGASGKDAGRDAALGRPNYALAYGAAQAAQHLRARLHQLHLQADALGGHFGLRRWIGGLQARLAAQLPQLRGETALPAAATAPYGGGRAPASACGRLPSQLAAWSAASASAAHAAPYSVHVKLP